jgi:hypothetical protein
VKLFADFRQPVLPSSIGAWSIRSKEQDMIKVHPTVKAFYAERAKAKPVSEYALYDFVSDDGTPFRIATLASALAMNRQLGVQAKLPGWFAVGDSEGKSLLCVENSTGAVSLFAAEPLDPLDAIGIAGSLETLLALAI